MRQYGHLTKKTCEGRAVQLLHALDDTIHYKTEYYCEALRKYARSERDPLTSTILDACRNHELELIIEHHPSGIYHILASNQDVRRMSWRLRDLLAWKHPTDRARILYGLDLSEAKLTSWTREDFSSPRWSEFVRLAMRLNYRAWFYDPKTEKRYF